VSAPGAGPGRAGADRTTRAGPATPPAAAPASALECAGCGARPDPETPDPFRCSHAAAGDDVDHVIARRLDTARLRFPEEGARNPFVTYRALLHSYRAARRGGLHDAGFVAIVERLDRAIAEVDGRGFAVTPCDRHAALGECLGWGTDGGVWIKDETRNVGGSHKARHLMGVLLWLEVMERLGRARRDGAGGPALAIASCGNAAFAAAILARAAGRPLRVFVPDDADPRPVAALDRLGARCDVCAREPGVPGDPSLRRMREAVRGGLVPFTCQGSENGLVIEGGETLAWEMVTALAARGVTLDRLFVQVGGGALASACVQAFREAVALGACRRLPAFHPVQTRGGAPLARAHARVSERMLRALGASGAGEAERAAILRDAWASDSVREALGYAARHRSEFMWPWEETPRSIASGILDDETYDWHAVVSGTIESGGWPVVVSEDDLREAHDLARASTGIAASHTGAAGLAGLIALRRSGTVARGESVAVLLTGAGR
jgi:threonine synthase